MKPKRRTFLPMTNLGMEKSLKKIILILVFTLFILISFQILPVRAAQTSEPASASSYTSVESDTSSSSDNSTQDSGPTGDQANDNGSDSEAASDTPTAEETDSDSEAASDIPTAEETDSDSEAAPDTPTAEETDSDSEAASDTPTAEETDSDSEAASDTPAVEETDSDSEAASDIPTAEENDSDSEAASDIPTAEENDSDSEAASDIPTAEENDSDSEAASDIPTAEENDSGSETASDIPTAEENDSDSEAASDIPTAGENDSDSEAASDTPTAEENDSNSEAASDTPTAEENDSDSETAPDTPAAEETGSDRETAPDTPAAEENDSDSETAPDTPVTEESASNISGGCSGQNSEISLKASDESQLLGLEQSMEEEPQLVTDQELDEVVNIPQTMGNTGDPWGYILNAVTEDAVAGSDVEVWEILDDGTSTNSEIIKEVNPVVTDDTGKYSFTVKETGDYQLKVTKEGYADYLSKVYHFDADKVTKVEDLYLVPLVTDAEGRDINIKHDLATGGQDISINNASKITFNNEVTIDTREHDTAGNPTDTVGNVTLDATDTIIGSNLTAMATTLKILTKDLTIDNSVILNNRVLNGEGNPTDKAGNITITAAGTMSVGSNAVLSSKTFKAEAETVTFAGPVTIDTREFDNMGNYTDNTGLASLTTDGNLSLNNKFITPKGNLFIKAKNITINNGLIVDTRETNNLGKSEGHAGKATFEAADAVTISTGKITSSVGDLTIKGKSVNWSAPLLLETREFDNSDSLTGLAGAVTLQATEDMTVAHNIAAPGGTLTLKANNLTVNDNIIADTRQINNEGTSIGNSGNITLTGTESLEIKNGAEILADVSAGSSFTPGTITLTAINDTIQGIDLLTMSLPTTSASVTVNGKVSGGDVVIRASAGIQEDAGVVDENDQSKADWAIDKLNEYIDDIVPLPVAARMRDDKAAVTIDTNAIITGSEEVTIESEATAEAKAKAYFVWDFVGYCKARANSELNINNGAVITAADNVLIRSNATTKAELDTTIYNIKNPTGFSLVLGVTNTDLTSHANIAQGADITGKNVNIQALGNSYNHVSSKSTDYTDGKLMALLSLNFTDSDVKAQVDGNVTANGEEITSKEDQDNRLTGGIGILARLDSDDSAKVVVGIGGTGAGGRIMEIGAEKASAAKDRIVGFFKKGYDQKTDKAAADKKNDSGANKNLQMAAACSCSKVNNDVNAVIGTTADLKSGLDLDVKSELIETSRIQTRSWTKVNSEESDPKAAVSAAVSIGLYDNAAAATFAGQSDAKQNTVIRSSVSYPFLLQPFKELAAGTFKNGLDLENGLDLVSDFLGMQDEMINSWTTSTATGENLGLAGAVTYLDYNNTAATDVESSARINQRTDGAYRSDSQSVEVDASTDFEQVSVVGNFDFKLTYEGLQIIAAQRLMPKPSDKNSLVDPYGIKSGKAGIGGAILLSYVNNNAIANVASGARVHAGSNGKMEVNAANKVTNIEFVQSGGQAGKFGVAGSFALDNENAVVLAQAARGTILDAGTLNIKANDISTHLNLLGGVMKGDGAGIGSSVGINEITRSVGAGIVQPDGSPRASTSNIEVSGDTNVEAGAKGDILVAAVAASIPAEAGDAPDQSKDTSETASGVPESGSTGDGKTQGKFGIGVSGAVSINEVNDTVRAFVDYSDRVKTGSLTIKAVNETNVLALTGSAAYTKSSQENSGTMAGAYSQVTLNGTTEASVIGTEMDTDTLTLTAERLGNLWAISAGGANSPGKNGIAIAGSVSINNIKNNTNVSMEDIQGSISGPTVAQAKDKSSMHVIAGAAGYGGRGGFGTAVAYNNMQNNTSVKIENSNWSQKATLELLAENSTRAGPVDESFDISGNPAENVEILAIAGSLGISPKGNFGGAGTVAINRIRNTVEASMTNSTCTAANDSQVTFTGRDDSNVFSIAGAVGAAKNVGIGAAVAYNEIGNKAYAFIDGSTLSNLTSLSMCTESSGIIKTLSLGVGGAQDAALGGSVSVNSVTSDASTYIKNSSISVLNNISISSAGSAGIGSVAGGFAGAGKAAMGAAIAVNNIGSADTPNQIKSYIENSKVVISAGNLSLASTSNSIIKSISAGGAGAEKCAIGGAISKNNIVNEIKSYIKDCSQGEKKLTAENNIAVDAVDNSVVSVIAGSVAGAGTGSIAGSAATVSIDSKTSAYIENSRVTSDTGDITLTATSNSVIFNIAAGAGVAGTFGGQGSVCLNSIHNDLSALIINSTVTAQGDISAIAVTVKRNKMPKGAAQPESDDTEITTFDGNPDDTDKDGEGGEAATHSLSSVQALAGSAAGGGTAGVGAVVAKNGITNILSAGINGSAITSNQGNVKLTAVSDASIEAVSAALAAAGTFAGAGSVSLNKIENQISSFIINSAVTANNPSNDMENGQLPGVNLRACDTSAIRSISGGIGIGGSAGLGGAAAYNEIANIVKAYIEGCNSKGGTPGYVQSSGSLTVKGESDAVIETISAGGAFGGYCGAAGSVSINTIGNTAAAFVKDSVADVDDNAYILAVSDNVIHGYGGAMAGGLVGISGAVVVNTVENTTRSNILNSTVIASGTGSNVSVKDWNDNGDESTEELKGLFVIADCNDFIEMYSGGAAGGTGAVADQTSVNHIKDTTEAFIGASNINSAADAGQWVKIKAHHGTRVDIWAGGLCVSAAGVGAASDRTLIENTTRAFISDSDQIDTGISSDDSNIYARGLEVITRTREDVNSKLAGMAFSGTASGAGAVSVVDLNGDNSATIIRSNVFAQGPVKIYAADKALIDSKLATFAASAGGSLAGSVAINTLGNTVKASVLGANLNSTGAIEVKSLGNDKITIMTGGVGLGQGGVGGVVSFNTVQAVTESAVTNSGTRFTLINQDSRFKPGGIFAPDIYQTVLVRAENTSTVDNTGLAGGAGIYIGGGAAVDVTRVQNRTVAYIGAGSKVYSKGDVNIKAQAVKTVDSKTAAVGAGLVGISGAISITSLGEAVSSEGADQFTGELREQVNSDASVKNLKINSSDSTASTASDQVNSLSAPNLGNILDISQDTSGKITAAYIEDGTAEGNRTEIISDGNVTIEAINNYRITGTRGSVAVGAVAAGASVTIINTYDRTKAFAGNYTIIRAKDLTVQADSTEIATAESVAAQAGLYAGGGNIAHVRIHPLVQASLGSYTNIAALNKIVVTAVVTPQAKASVYGVTVAGSTKVAVADSVAESSPIVNANIGQNAQVTCGYQALEGNPVLTFSSGSQLTGNPNLTFTVKSVRMSGNPTLHFAPGAKGANDTVTRNDSRTWNGDGFNVGDYISICGTDKNNAVYQITSISGDGKTLTLNTKGIVQIEDKSGISVFIERGGEITRSSGSWIDDGFIDNEFILVSGSGSNDGYYEIGRIKDALTLELDVSDEIQNEATSGVSIIGDTADMIRRSTGSWLTDGFKAGQLIKVTGTAGNDGQYRIKSISSDGKVLILDSLNLFTKEQATGVNVTIVDYSNSGSNNSGLKVNASESLPDAGSTAEAYAFGAGGALLSADCTMATAKNTSTVAAWAANNAEITVAGTVEISAQAHTKQTAGADGYNGGAVQAGNNKASASSAASGSQLNITTAGLQDNVNISAFSLLISSYRNDENYAEAFAGSGGLFDLVLIEAGTANNATTRASVGTGAQLDVDRLQVVADHTAKFNSKADSISGAGVGIGAGRAKNYVDSTVEANIGSSSNILARDMIVYANNRTDKDWLANSNYNVRSRSGAIVGCQAAESKTVVINTTNINVGDNASIKIPGSVFNPGRLNMEILNTVLARDKTNIDIGGAIAGAKAVSEIINTNTGTVQIGKNAKIVSAGDINLSARTYSNIKTYAFAKCYGAAGLADADSKAVSTSTNNVRIKEGAKLTSYGQINLLAGQSSEGYPNTCYALASADVENWTAVPVETSPKASGIINLNNYINIEKNASLRAVKDANLLNEEGIRVTDGTGEAKNLYSELLGMDCRTIDTAINVNSQAQVDGSIEVGIQNQQLLTIEADGTVSTKTDGITFITAKYELHAKLLEELELARRMREEYAGTTAAEAFDDEIKRLEGELIQLGHQVYTDHGQTMIELSVWADFIIVDDIWAQSSNINILAGKLTGSGTFKARGDARIEIINKSPAYLRLKSLTIPENAGGKVMFNRSSLDSGWLNGVKIVSGTSSGEPKIIIRNTYNGGNNPDIELYGKIENRNGSLYVNSTGGISSKGDIRAGSVILEATGDFIQSYVDTFYSVGGEPRKIWETVTKISEGLKIFYNPLVAQSAIAQVLNSQPQSKIEAANIVISARYLNINGAIISGHPEQSLVLGSDMNSKIAKFWRWPHWNYHDNLLAENGGVKAYFDLITRRVIVEGVSAEGGYVSLFGQIMNTGKGRIEALDGYASIHIENHTNYDMVVGALDTGRGSEGMVVIKDTAPMTWQPGKYTKPVVRVYTRIGDQIQVWDSVEKNHLVSVYNGNSNPVYNPLAGLRYSWVTAQSKVTRESTTYRKASWLGVDWLAKDPDAIYEQHTYLLDEQPLLDGEYIVYRPDLVSSPYKYNFKIEEVAQFDANGNKILDKNGNPVPVLVEQRSWVKKKWWGKKTYYLKQVYEYATKNVNYHSIRADYPISIIFKGGTEGTVDITSDHGLIINGIITNPNGVTNVSARRSVEQREGTYIESKKITVIGDRGIGTRAALSIDLKGGALTARALQGIINIKELNGELKLSEVTNNNGEVFLSANGDIIGASAASVVAGNMVSLSSESGGIGRAVNTPLLVNSGSDFLEGVKAQAYNDIYLKKANGDINLIKAISESGDVYVEADNGSIFDANRKFSRDTYTEGYIMGKWNNLNLSGQKTAAELYCLIGVTLKTDRKPDIWAEDLNVKGNNLTLKALNGKIGRITGTVTIDLSDLANLDKDSKLTLISADPNDIKFYDQNNNLIASDDNNTLAKYAVVSLPDEIDVRASGNISAQAKTNVFLRSDREAMINRVKGGQVRISSSQGISNGVNDGSINITSDGLVLIAENGAIGNADKALTLAVKDGSILRALARDGIYLNQQASGANRSGILNIDYIHTPGNVSLQAAGSILRTNPVNDFDILCSQLNLQAGGFLGKADNSLKIEQGDGNILKAVAGTGVFLEELTGNMNIDLVQADSGDIVLKTPGSILAGANDGHTAITGNNIDLTASSGQVGEQDRVLIINSSNTGSGRVDINGFGDIYFREAAGNLNLGLVRSISKGKVFISSAGAITNEIGAGTNVDADLLEMNAADGAGTLDNPIRTVVTGIEGSGGTGGFYIDNQGGITVGGVDITNGIQADGNIQITAHSPVSIEEDVIAGGDIVITAGTTDGLDDLVIAQDRKVQAGGLITLTAGDSIILNPNVTLKAGTTVDVNAGSSIIINSAMINGGESVTIKANGGNLTLTNATVKSGNNINAQSSGDLVLTTATVEGAGTVFLKGVNMPITVNSLVKAGGAVSADASGYIKLLNSFVDGENIIDMTATDYVTIDQSIIDGAGSVTIKANGGNLTVTNATVKSGNNIDVQACGDLVLTTAEVDGVGTVFLKGASMPITANSLIKAGGAVSADASGYIKLLNSFVDGKNTIDMTAADYVTIDRSIIDGAGSVTIKANGGNLTVTNATVKSRNNIDAEGSADLIISDTTVDGAGNITIKAKGGNVTVTNTTVKSGNNIDVKACGDLVLTTAEVDGAGTVFIKGVSMPITADTLIKAGEAVSADASGYIKLLNSSVDGENTLDMTAADYVTIEQSTVDGVESITIKANGGNLTVTNATVNSSQCATIQAARDINLIMGIVEAGNSVEIRAADNILIDFNSVVSAINNVRMVGDSGNNDPGTGCKVEIYGTLTGQHMEAWGQEDNDDFIINGATIRGPLTIFGGSGNDQYTVTDLQSISTSHDGRKDRITMDGQEGSDMYKINLVGAGEYIVEALDTGVAGIDKLILNGTVNEDTFLLRQKFIANLHGMEVERIDYDQNIENLYIYSFAGKDRFYLDDNSALTEIYGAEGDDVFQIGQVFGSARDENAGVASGDEITTVLTTRGYLSRGVSYETKICGASGNDNFAVYSNQAHLILQGEAGNDTFIIRAFALADPDDPHQPRTSVDGGSGDDYIEYNVNSLVDIYGGSGNDTVRVIGSEFDDVFVIDENGIVGAGLNIHVEDSECYEAYGMEGNDTFYIQGTRAGMVTKIFGGYGSDSFYVLGDVTKHVSTSGTYEAMVAHDLDIIKGTLFIEGGVSNEGEDCVLVSAVTLPAETNPPLSDVVAEDENKMVDSLYVYNDDSSEGDIGWLTVGHLQGLGMGTGTTVNQGTPENPEYVDYPGGIIFNNLEVVEILLGSGDDIFNIENTSSGTITAIHGGGGSDRITAAGQGGPLVIYGETDVRDLRYSGRKGSPSENGHWFNNPGEEIIDVSSYLAWAAIYGGPGDDFIIGTGLSDCLAGGPGSDRIDAGCGDDVIYGDSGFNVDLGNRRLYVYNPWSFGSDFLDGGYGNDIIFGDYGVPCLLSLRNKTLDIRQVEIQSTGIDGGDDYILGRSGDDVLIGGLGSDTIDGQEGNDLILGDNALQNPYYKLLALMPSPSLQVVENITVISYTCYTREPDSQTGISASWLTKLLHVMSSPSVKMADQTKSENIVGIRYNRYNKDNTAQYLIIINHPDTSAAWWAKLLLMLKGDRYGNDDYLAGGPGNDAILGQGGDDTIQGDGTVKGTRIWVRASDGKITQLFPSISAVTDGDDYIEGGRGNDTIFGNLGNDDIIGESSDLFGLETDNLAPDVADVIFGGSGTDMANFDKDDDAIIGGNGNIYRILQGDQGTVLFLNPEVGALTRRAMEPLDYEPLKGELYRSPKVYDPAPGDVIHGELGNDFIHGMAKDDFLYGEDGNDHIIGGSGKDKIFGGSGQNQIIEDDFLNI